MKLQFLISTILLFLGLGMGSEWKAMAESGRKETALETRIELGRGAIATIPLPYSQVPQPVHRIDPNQPVRIQLLNYSGLPLDYRLVADDIEPNRLAAGESILLSDFALPASISVQPTQARVNLKYDLTIDANRIILKLRRVSSVSPGDKAFDVQQSGDIYIHSQNSTFW